VQKLQSTLKTLRAMHIPLWCTPVLNCFYSDNRIEGSGVEADV